MCLAVPSEIISLNDSIATISIGGAQREVSLLLLPEEVRVGDFVLIHAGFAIQKMDREAGLEAHRILHELKESGVFDSEELCL
ncbi:MAG TPA: HypC/HybG/HupF family hydrogenase formation chaperone [Thermodesulfovibrionales bacterium]|nr:HypC/HybG/HupF family hydrogenase formation chaperone [Thermodesulfovibrionales bacterium]